MYFLFGLDPALRNVAILSAPFTTEESVGLECLRSAYLRFLASEGHLVARTPEGPALPFVSDPRQARELLWRALREPLLAEPGNRGVSQTQEALKVKLLQGFCELCRYFPELEGLFSLVVHAILIVPSKVAGGVEGEIFGSTPRALGAIWIKDFALQSMGELAVAELLFHELTHTLLFIEECCHGLYRYELLEDTRCYSISAVMAKPRPFDRALHSILVATELYRARQKGWGQRYVSAELHGQTPVLRKRGLEAAVALASLNRRQSVLTDRGDKILVKCLNALES